MNVTQICKYYVFCKLAQTVLTECSQGTQNPKTEPLNVSTIIGI